MNEFLAGKKAVVTGASKGIGFAIARSLLAQGCDTVICARDEKGLRTALDDLEKTAEGRKIAGTTADVSDPGQVRQLFEFADQKLGTLNVLVNNAGIGVFRPAADLSIEEWNRTVGTNLSGAFYCSREALQRFRQGGAGGGSIINVSSLAGRNPIAGGAAYNASKFGLNGFTEAMMLDHRQENVRVSYIMPGSVDTEFDGNQPQNRSSWKIAPEDIAEIVLDILRMPERTLISRVEVRPSRPQKN